MSPDLWTLTPTRDAQTAMTMTVATLNRICGSDSLRCVRGSETKLESDAVSLSSIRTGLYLNGAIVAAVMCWMTDVEGEHLPG